MKIKYLALDAMGVIYKDGDDVTELLIPFIKTKNNNISNEAILENYRKASLGEISSDIFWENIGLSKDVENEYLSGFCLNDGLIDFLDKAFSYFDNIICLSNDVSEWSKKLRTNFNLTKYISSWFISGDLKCRKPSPKIYRKVLDDLANTKPGEILFIDDNIENIIAAKKLGFKVILLNQNHNDSIDSIYNLEFHTIINLISKNKW